jgi:F0F1-type ATP synthase assembly protein I
MGMQDTMGQLKEAVGSLKEQSKHHGDKLDQIGKDVHAAKVTMGVLSAVVLGAAALIGWVITTYIAAHPAH